MGTLIGIALLFGFFYIVAKATKFAIKAQMEPPKVSRAEYDRLLMGKDKMAALHAGRKYYASLRGCQLSVYDEQAIANDLNSMKS